MLLKKRGAVGLQDTKGGKALLALILCLGTGGLIGLFFGWTIGLWVALGLGVIMLFYLIGVKVEPDTRTEKQKAADREKAKREKYTEI